MNALVNHAGFGPLPTVFQGAAQVPGMNDEFSGGIVAGFPVLSIKGKTWTVKSRGEETILKQPNGDPLFGLDLVIVKATPNLTKVYYPNGYTDGANEKPSCWSSDGIKPDAAVENKCHAVCATCPMNQFGSKVTDAGKQAKACADSKRVAVVPAGNFEELGGPALLRIPAATLVPFKEYADRMSRNGFPLPAIATRVSFDAAEAFPKLVFRELRPLTNEEAAKIVELRSDARVARILAEATEITAGSTEQPKSEVNFAQAPGVTAPGVTAPAPSVATQATAGIVPPANATQVSPQAAAAIKEAQEQLAREQAAREAAAAQQAAAGAQQAMEAEIRARVEAEVRARIEAEARAKVAADMVAADMAATRQAAQVAADPTAPAPQPVIEDAVIVGEIPAPAAAAAPADFDDMLDKLIG